MRTIEKNMLEAVRAERNWKSGNTEVFVTSHGDIKVFLHKNLIAMKTCGSWYYSLADHNTKTTRSRLNVLGCDVHQRNFLPYRNGEVWWGDF